MIDLNKSLFNKNFFSYLYIFLPIALITGPFISDLIVVVICTYLVFSFNSFKNDEIFSYKYHYFFILFYFSICISSLFSEYFLYSIKSSFSYLRFGIFSIAIYFIIKNNIKLILILTKIFLTIYFTLLIDSVFQYLFGFNILGWTFEDHNFRVTSFFGDDEVLGSYIARLFPFVLSIILFSREELNFRFNNYFIILLFGASSVITLISGERTSLVLFLLSIFLMFFSCHKLRKIILFCSLIILISFTSIIVSNEKTRDRMLNQTLNQLGLHSESERIVIFSKTYEDHYKIAYKMFKQKPILGHGPKTFRKYCSEPENYLNEIACTTHPHNILMQLLSETGLAGTIFYFTIFVYLSLKLIKITTKGLFYKKYINKDYVTLIYIFYFINLFPLVPSGNFFNNWLSIIYYIPLGYLFFLVKYKKNKS